MTIPTPKVEIGLDLTESNLSPFFALDDELRGVLDNEQYTLGGTILYDVTDRVRSIQIDRGRPNIFANFPAAQATIEFNNHDRAFDPLYANSPFVGNIVPRREVKIFSGGEIQFSGWIDDWNLSYTPDGDSVADAIAYDAFSFLTNQALSQQTPTQQLTGARIEAILDDPAVDWSPTLRDIDAGLSQVGNQEISDDTNALGYMNKVAETEPGLFFVARDGKVTFREKLRPINVPDAIDFNQTDGIPFSDLQVVYGSELLYNEITIANQGGGTAIASDIASQAAYGIRALSKTDLLGATDTQAAELAVTLVSQFSEPEYRFEGLAVDVHALTPEQQAQVLQLELGSVARIQFTPNGIGDPINRYGEIIKIGQFVSTEQHIINYSFREITEAVFTLDSAVFGTLNEANVLGRAFNPWTLGDAIYGRLSAGMAVQ